MADIVTVGLGTAGGDPAEPPSAIVNLANRLLQKFNISTKIDDVCDISASLFVVLFESLLSDRLPGIIRPPLSKEDEVHNCQIVIDVLSTEVLKDSLSHIRGADIVAGDSTAILNLLDIFSYLLEYFLKRIEDDEHQLEEGSVCTTEADQEPVATSDKGNGGPESKLGAETSNTTNNNGSHLDQRRKDKALVDRNDNRQAFKHRDVITHEDFYAMSYGGISSKNTAIRTPSPIGLDTSHSLQKTIDSDYDLDLVNTEEGRKEVQESVPNKPKVAWDAKPTQNTGSADAIIDGVTLRGKKPSNLRTTGAKCSTARGVSAAACTATASVTIPSVPRVNLTSDKTHHYTFTHHLYHHYDRDSIPGGKTARAPVQHDEESPWETSAYSVERPIPHFSSTMPAPYREREVRCEDPLRSTVGPIPYHTRNSPERERPERGRSSARSQSSSYNDLRELVERTAALTRVALATSPVRAKTTLELDLTEAGILDQPRPVISSQSARLAKELNAQGLNSAYQREPASPEKASKKVAFASLRDSGIHDYEDYIYGREAYNDLLMGWRDSPERYVSDADSDFHQGGLAPTQRQTKGRTQGKPRKSKPGVQKKGGVSSGGGASQAKLARFLAQNRQPELGAAHMTLKTEDRALRKKQELLQKFYEQDHKEYAEDVDYMLERDRQRSKELEEECVKKCTESGLKKKAAKKPIKAKQPRNKSSNKLNTVKPSSSATDKSETITPPPSLPLHLESEEDLLPALLEEFPHLHISEHTWHELWRRGLSQIESLTRAHQEGQRKKSHAQCQLEEAAERHELLANIMKKQLEHTQRLRDIKEQRQYQIATKNKMHEKRIQSARARRYYNEYQVRARAKQLSRRTKEELVFRDLFKDALKIQKERIKDVRQYATDQRKKQESKRQNEIDSLENFYHDQFQMLAEKLATERQETDVRDAAQHKIMQRLKRELRQKMESEIQQYQEQLCKDDDDVHFRKCDADRVLKQLHLARYSAKI